MLENYSYYLRALINLSIAIFLILFIFSICRVVLKYLLAKRHDWFKPVIFKDNEIISSEKLTVFVSSLIKVIRLCLIVLVLYLTIPFVLQEIPETHDFAIDLLLSIKTNVMSVGHGILNYIPSLFFIALVIFVCRSVIRFLKFLFHKIETEDLKIEGFYPEWAETTFQLSRFFVCVFGFVIIYPYLPGSGSKILEGISVFLGVLVSIGSSSAISNFVAGIMISYMRPFQSGDYIKIDSTMGQVLEKGLVVTKLLTYKNEEVSIPNTQVLNSQIYNYSALAEKGELILHTEITIGYDVSWQKVYELFYLAASRCEHINQDKKPFVLQTKLGDKNISYQLNIYTYRADLIPSVYSELHLHLQDTFAESKVELLSPSFMILRDGNNSVPVIPDSYKV